MNKIKTKILDFLPVVVLVLWAVMNISMAFFYTQLSTLFYHLANLFVNMMGVSLFWASIKYHNKYLKNKHKKKHND